MSLIFQKKIKKAKKSGHPPPPRIAGMSPPTSSVSSKTQPAPDLQPGQIETLKYLLLGSGWNIEIFIVLVSPSNPAP